MIGDGHQANGRVLYTQYIHCIRYTKGRLSRGPHPKVTYHHVPPETKKDMTHSLRKSENLQACLVVVVVVVVLFELASLNRLQKNGKRTFFIHTIPKCRSARSRSMIHDAQTTSTPGCGGRGINNVGSENIQGGEVPNNCTVGVCYICKDHVLAPPPFQRSTKNLGGGT